MIRHDDFQAALTELRNAAQFATKPGPSGERFTPGLSIAVVFSPDDGRRVVHCEGFGVRSLDAPEAPGPDTLFPCASLSKPVSATIIAATRPGKWNEPVEPYHLAHSNKPVTLADWLSHTSGLPDHAGDLIEDMNPQMPRDTIIRNVMEYQTGLDESRAHSYTNFGFTMGCLGAMQALGHRDWETFADDVLHQRLNMGSSTYRFTTAFARGNRVVPHKGRPTESAAAGWEWHVVPSKDERNPSRQAPAGGLISCASDMARFIDAHLRRELGDFPMRSAAGTYSLGWNVGTNPMNGMTASHSGAFTLGAATHLRIDPDQKVGLAILTNGEPVGVPESLAHIFFTRLYSQPSPGDYGAVLAYGRNMMLKELYKQKDRNNADYSSSQRRPIPSTLPQGEVFRGFSQYYGSDIVIDRDRDRLRLRMGKGTDGQPTWNFDLTCYDDSNPRNLVFVYETTGENEVGISPLTMELGANNKVQSITDHWLDLESPSRPSGTGVGVIRAR